MILRSWTLKIYRSSMIVATCRISEIDKQNAYEAFSIKDDEATDQVSLLMDVKDFVQFDIEDGKFEFG